MKISVETLGIRRKGGYSKAIEMIKKAGFDAVDFIYCCIPLEEPILNDEYIEYAYKTKACIEENGLDIVQTHAPIVFEYGQKMDESGPCGIFQKHSRKDDAGCTRFFC